ncbi:MAG: hypothetical protein HOK98_08385 [Rhodospirillaceae bacterium]|nr:hypothetical protein [Rhodospirillaceae bacterium]MBT6403835.1 hypothetical protein [Rhodospirillaceae bacterium]MBT6536190.1 hypothetical protein [Rhodospirillaceae bacterium]
MPIIVCGCAISVAILLGVGTGAAQENRSVDGEELGASNWHVIAPDDSEFRGSRNAGAFAMLRNELPDRLQESWRHPSNLPRGPLVTMFYERLHDNFFASEMFEADFRSVFNLAFAARGVDLDDARVVALDDKTKAAFVSYASTTCVFMMRVFGPVTEYGAISNGDRNARLFVCQRGEADENFLGELAISMLSTLTQDGQEIGIPGRSAPPLPELMERLFTREEKA